MIELRLISPDELPAVVADLDGVMQRAYRTTSFRRQLEWYAATQTEGFVVAEEDGVIVGTGCPMAYPSGRFGWIGLVATEPTHERRGVGRMVTERAAEVLARQGCASVLDASLAGGPLYSRMGFVDHGVTRVLTGPMAPMATTSGDRDRRAQPFTIDDLPSVARFDAEAFGADRRQLLAVILDQNPGRAALVRDDDGAVCGYFIAQEFVIGPLVAVEDALIDLVLDALELPWEVPPRISVPHESTHMDALARLGFEQFRELRHMRRGIDALPGNTALIAGRASLGVG